MYFFELLFLILNLARWIIPIAVAPNGIKFTTVGCLADDISLYLKDSKKGKMRPTYTIRNKMFHGPNENPSDVGVVVLYA